MKYAEEMHKQQQKNMAPRRVRMEGVNRAMDDLCFCYQAVSTTLNGSVISAPLAHLLSLELHMKADLDRTAHLESDWNFAERDLPLLMEVVNMIVPQN